MLNSHGIYSTLLACRQVKMLWLQESLMQQGLPHVVFVELLFTGVLKQVLIEVLHHAVLNTFSVQGPFICRFVAGAAAKAPKVILRWENLVEFLGHFRHQFLYLLSLFFPRAIVLDDLRQRVPDERLDGLPHQHGLITLELLIKRVENAI